MTEIVKRPSAVGGEEPAEFGRRPCRLEQRGDDFLVKATLADVRHHLAGVGKEELLDSKLAERLKGAVFMLRMTSSSRILVMTGYEDLLKRITDGGKAATKSAPAAFSLALVHNIFVDIFGSLPEKAENAAS